MGEKIREQGGNGGGGRGQGILQRWGWLATRSRRGVVVENGGKHSLLMGRLGRETAMASQSQVSERGDAGGQVCGAAAQGLTKVRDFQQVFAVQCARKRACPSSCGSPRLRRRHLLDAALHDLCRRRGRPHGRNVGLETQRFCRNSSNFRSASSVVRRFRRDMRGSNNQRQLYFNLAIR